jgi:REP element-mobilizing transposase RayT
MGLFDDSHQEELRTAGWHSRGYLPHFDGIEIPQFITIHLADSIPRKVIKRWKEELKSLKYEQERILLQRRIERYLDQGYGEALLKDTSVATMVQNALLRFDGTRYNYFDRYMRNQEHFRRTVQYIVNNPVKARLCETPSCWPFSSAWFKKSR